MGEITYLFPDGTYAKPSHDEHVDDVLIPEYDANLSPELVELADWLFESGEEDLYHRLFEELESGILSSTIQGLLTLDKHEWNVLKLPQVNPNQGVLPLDFHATQSAEQLGKLALLTREC